MPAIKLLTKKSAQSVDFELLFKTAPSLYVVLKPDSPNFTILSANDAYAKATHTKLENLIGHYLLERFPANPEDPRGYGRAQVLESLEYVAKHSEPHIIPLIRYDVRKLPEEGGGFVEKYWSMVTTPVLNPEGKIEYIIHRVEDVTEKKRLNDERQRFFDEGADMVMVGGFDGYLKRVNSAWQEVLGWTEEELITKPWLEFVHPDDQEITIKVGQDIISGKPLTKFENRYRCKNGDYRWLRWKVKPFPEEQLIYGGASDVTDYKKIEAELVKARDNAEAANIAKTEFLSNMSHEIRTPMNAVIGLSNILAMSKPLTEKQGEFIKTLQMSADSLLALINDLLDIAKIEARSIELEKIPFSIVKLVQEVISMMMVRTQEKGLAFAFEQKCPGVDKQVFIGDPTRLRQILLNLCSNDIKFTEKGSVQIDILCKKTEDPNKEIIQLVVKDTGTGIVPENLETIFHKFVQADSSINRKYGGTGLGLAITKTLTEIMNGTIEVKSQVGIGSTFIVSLPLEITHDDELKHAILNIPKAIQAPENNIVKPCVLLVEDYFPNVMVASNFLEEFGYSYEVANSGQEAIEKIKSRQFFAVLMDVQMHGINGLDATRLIRSWESQQDMQRVHIIGMTAHALAGDRERCLGAGMDDYIPKPFNPEELKEKIKAAAKKQLLNVSSQ